MPDSSTPEPEPVLVPDHDLDDLGSVLSRLTADSRAHGRLLDRLAGQSGAAHDLSTASSDGEAVGGADHGDGQVSVFILALDGAEYAEELAALTAWVHNLLLPVYGREITASRPWCARWHEHPEAVARLHALWLAWQQLTDAQAGLSGPATWHRDHLDHTLAQLRSPEGPFAACTTSANRPHHRLLATPAPAEGPV